MMITIAPTAAVIHAIYEEAPCKVAAETAGAGSGDPICGNTVIASFMFPVAQ